MPAGWPRALWNSPLAGGTMRRDRAAGELPLAPPLPVRLSQSCGSRIVPMLRLASLVLVLAAPAATPDDAFVPLFDGRTTDGWVQVGGQPGNWSVADGRLVTQGQGGGWLSTEKTYAD